MTARAEWQAAASPFRADRLWLRGGGCVLVALSAGDHLTLVDPEGLQPVEVFAFAADFGPAPLEHPITEIGRTPLSARLTGSDDASQAAIRTAQNWPAAALTALAQS